MNREMKFRVWDFRDSSFVMPGTYGMHMDGFLYRTYGPNILAETFQVGEKLPIAQFYTGVKDKNDREIYEGDIVRVLYTKDGVPNHGNSYVARVRYRTDVAAHSLCGSIDEGPFRHDMYLLDEPAPLEPGTVYSNGRTYRIAAWRLEVIGNILENPELLKTARQISDDIRNDIKPSAYLVKEEKLPFWRRIVNLWD